MKTTYKFSRPSLALSLTLIASLLFVSCGSFESVSYHDGVYGERSNNQNRQSEQFTEQEEAVTYQNDSGSYYQALFAQKAADYGAMNTQQDSVFTDVESYSSQSYNQNNPDYTSNYGGGNAPWGENPSQVNINIIDNGWGWNNGFGWGGGLWNGWGPGWNNWGWGGGFGWNNWGWNRFGWGGGLGWGWGGGFGWNNWGWNRFGWGGGVGPWGPGWNAWGWNNGFGWGNGIAFANGNRGFRNNFNNGAFGRESTSGRNTTRRNVGRGSDGYSRGRATNRSNNSTISRRGSSRNSNATSRRSSSRSSSARTGTSRRSSSSARTSRSTSRSSGSMRSSRSSSRSSGSMRSSRSSGRSSGGMRSGGGRSSGRRG